MRDGRLELVEHACRLEPVELCPADAEPRPELLMSKGWRGHLRGSKRALRLEVFGDRVAGALVRLAARAFNEALNGHQRHAVLLANHHSNVLGERFVAQPAG
jgi:hypothetical protein